MGRTAGSGGMKAAGLKVNTEDEGSAPKLLRGKAVHCLTCSFVFKRSRLLRIFGNNLDQVIL